MNVNEKIQQLYIEWLDKKIELGKKEIERCSGNALLLNNAKFTFEKYMEDNNSIMRDYKFFCFKWAFIIYINL